MYNKINKSIRINWHRTSSGFNGSTEYSIQTPENTHSGSFSKIDHMLVHKTNAYYRCKKRKNYFILYDHNAVKLKIDSKQISSKCVESRRLTNYWMENGPKRKWRNKLKIYWSYTMKLLGHMNNIQMTEIYISKSYI